MDVRRTLRPRAARSSGALRTKCDNQNDPDISNAQSKPRGRNTQYRIIADAYKPADGGRALSVGGIPRRATITTTSTTVADHGVGGGSKEGPGLRDITNAYAYASVIPPASKTGQVHQHYLAANECAGVAVLTRYGGTHSFSFGGITACRRYPDRYTEYEYEAALVLLSLLKVPPPISPEPIDDVEDGKLVERIPPSISTSKDTRPKKPLPRRRPRKA